MKNIDSNSHVRGESVYVDDLLPLKGTLFATVVGAPVAAGKLNSFDISDALTVEGVHRIITAADIPGENQIGGIIQDEQLLAEVELHFQGQPVAIILSDSELTGRVARKRIQFDIEEHAAVVSPREAYQKNLLIHPPRTFALGDTDQAWSQCSTIVEGSVTVGGQEHLYLETQGSYCFITEDGHLRVISSTQGPTAVQRTVAKVLGIPMHKIEVDVRRLGGGFGGKEDQATPWAVMAALATHLTGRPVKLILSRHDDMYMTGKRHPYDADYKLGLDSDGKILAYEVTFYQNAGSAADLSPAVLERTLFHTTNSYFIPHVRATGISCRTNLPPNTAFRGFGGPQGMFIMESALTHAATELAVPKWQIQQKNLLADGDVFPYGQKLENCQIRPAWDDAMHRYNLDDLSEKVRSFNASSKFVKKGISIMPITFGISFTNSSLNQAGALVNIYQDGSIGVSTGAVEMGQGVNTRILQVPHHVFSVDPNLIHIESTNTSRVINTSPSAASSTHDLNGKATLIACQRLKSRLLSLASSTLGFPVDELDLENNRVTHRGAPTDLDWKTLIDTAYWSRIDLAEHGFYATPDVNFDKSEEKGHPFAYYSYGVAIVQAELDVLRGRYSFDFVKISHDFGESMNKIIDLGQMEGGVVQGLGWMTMEDLQFDDHGRLLSNTLSTYKIPDYDSAPKVIETHFLEGGSNPYGLFRSKAIGEPPLMYGIGGFFAIYEAMKAFRETIPPVFHAPMTPERVITHLYGQADSIDPIGINQGL